MKHGRHITIEGINGAGKSTQVDMLVAALRRADHDVVPVREPSSGRYGSELRSSLFSVLPPPADLVMLFALDRLDLARRVVRPAIERGATVVQDRGYPSSMAFQGGLLRDPEWVRLVNRYAPVPDLTVVLAVSTAVATARIAARDERDGFDSDVALARVASRVFRLLPALLPDARVVVIECGALSADDVHAMVGDAVRRHLPGMLP